MNRIYSELKSMISRYLDPIDIQHISTTDKKNHQSTKTQIAVPYIIYYSVFGDCWDIRYLGENIRFLQELISKDPKYRIELWKDISDHFLSEKIKGRKRSFVRPHCGFIPQFFKSLEQAKCHQNWKPHLLPHATIRIHEMYRLDSLRFRFYRKNAPTAIALIY